MKTRLGAALAVFVLALIVILPSASQLAPYPIEDEYGWGGAYFGARLLHLDFSPGPGTYDDPGWAAENHWTLTQPMASRFVFGLALAVSGSHTPPVPFDWRTANVNDPAHWYDNAQTMLSPAARWVMRLAAAVCAGLGLACIAARLGWAGALGGALFLLLPNVPTDLGYGWAEGPLLLGIGLCVLAYGKPWFGPALGLAAAFKLTALGLWPALLIPRSSGRGRWAMLLGAVGAAGMWTLFDPPSWFSGGPLYLVLMLADRLGEHATQSRTMGGLFGEYFPTRYLLPFELTLAVGGAWLVLRVLAHVRKKDRISLGPALTLRALRSCVARGEQ
ncbi:MAG TPA: hypothetical protein VIR57_01505 [Chloroflexota bacterium]